MKSDIGAVERSGAAQALTHVIVVSANGNSSSSNSSVALVNGYLDQILPNVNHPKQYVREVCVCISVG